MNDAIVGRPSSSRISSTTFTAGSQVKRMSTSLRKPRSCVPWPTLKLILRLALAGVAAINLHDAVLEAQSGK